MRCLLLDLCLQSSPSRDVGFAEDVVPQRSFGMPTRESRSWRFLKL